MMGPPRIQGQVKNFSLKPIATVSTSNTVKVRGIVKQYCPSGTLWMLMNIMTLQIETETFSDSTT